MHKVRIFLTANVEIDLIINDHEQINEALPFFLCPSSSGVAGIITI